MLKHGRRHHTAVVLKKAEHTRASSYPYVRTVPNFVPASRPHQNLHSCTNLSLSADARVDGERSTSGQLPPSRRKAVVPTKRSSPIIQLAAGLLCQSEIPSISRVEARTATPYRGLAHKNNTHGSELVLVSTNGSIFRIGVKTLPKLTQIVRTLVYWPMHVLYPFYPTENAQPLDFFRPRDKKPSSLPNARAPQCSLLPACCVPGLELAVYLVPRS